MPARADVQVIEHCWIPMPDGIRLSARIWLPANGPHPAILEYIPYRKRDMVRARDERNHPFFARHGYACLRVDMRGSGDSEGVMPDMYHPVELNDARHVIEWIAAQPWCNGRVGMFGTSWGGTASLQAAVDAPGPLMAVIANCATIDRYEDDIHWTGGCLLTDSLEWGAALPAILSAPPDAATAGEGWWKSWQSRLESLTHPLENWMRQKTRGGFWRHGSVRFAANRLSCPILSIGGWADRYSNSVLPLVRERPDICWGIVGPWGHHYPDHGEPGPAIGFQQLALEWWDHWLKPEPDRTAPWPRLRLWRRGFDTPQDRLTVRNGEWIETGPSGSAECVTYHLGRGVLTRTPHGQAEQCKIPFDIRHGKCAGDTGFFGRVGGLPLDQAADDARALVFDTDPLDEDFDLIGHARLAADILRSAPAGQLVCRICDVAPDGRVNLVTRGMRNLELGETLDHVVPFEIGQPRHQPVVFPSTAYRFAPGHRIRLALGASYWPLVWPSGGPNGVRISLENATLVLPSAPAGTMPLSKPFPDAKPYPESPSWEAISGGPITRSPQEIRDGVIHSSWEQPPTGYRFPDKDLEIVTRTAAIYRLPVDAPDKAVCETCHRITIQRPDGRAEIVSKVTATGESAGIRIEAQLKARWNGADQCCRAWSYFV